MCAVKVLCLPVRANSKWIKCVWAAERKWFPASACWKQLFVCTCNYMCVCVWESVWVCARVIQQRVCVCVSSICVSLDVCVCSLLCCQGVCWPLERKPQARHSCVSSGRPPRSRTSRLSQKTQAAEINTAKNCERPTSDRCRRLVFSPGNFKLLLTRFCCLLVNSFLLSFFKQRASLTSSDCAGQSYCLQQILF